MPNQILLHTHNGWKIFDTNQNRIIEADFSGIELDNRIRKISHDSYQNVWFCTEQGLFKKKNGSQKLNFFDLSVGKYCSDRSNIVNNVFESSKSGLWILTENGLFLYDYEKENIESIGMDEEKGGFVRAWRTTLPVGEFDPVELHETDPIRSEGNIKQLYLGDGVRMKPSVTQSMSRVARKSRALRVIFARFNTCLSW